MARMEASSDEGIIWICSPVWIVPDSRRPEIERGFWIEPLNTSVMVIRSGFSREWVIGSEESRAWTRVWPLYQEAEGEGV